MKRDQVVLAIHPIHAEAILEGKKRFELRSRFPKVELGATVYLYCTAPISAVVGGFSAGSVRNATPADLWDDIRQDGFNLTKDEFDGYVGGRKVAVAIQVDRPFRLLRPISRNELKQLSGSYTPPQSVGFLNELPILTFLQSLRVIARGT